MRHACRCWGHSWDFYVTNNYVHGRHFHFMVVPLPALFFISLVFLEISDLSMKPSKSTEKIRTPANTQLHLTANLHVRHPIVLSLLARFLLLNEV